MLLPIMPNYLDFLKALTFHSLLWKEHTPGGKIRSLRSLVIYFNEIPPAININFKIRKIEYARSTF